MRRQIPIALLLAGVALVAQGQGTDHDTLLDSGRRGCAVGELQLAADALQRAHALATTSQLRSRAAGAWGLTLFRMHRYEDAESLLKEAYETSEDSAERATLANDLGNLYLGQRQESDARRFYAEAQRLAPDNTSLQVSVALNLVRLAPADSKPQRLQQLFAELGAVPDQSDRARYAANLGAQALELGTAGKGLAYDALLLARQLAAGTGDARIQAQSLAGLGRLYESEGRGSEALSLIDEAVQLAQTVDARDILFRIEWQRGRLLRSLGQPGQAVAAYRRAVDHIEAIRMDIPIEYEGGRSSFRETLEPIYLGLADLLLSQAEAESGERAQQDTRDARDVVELIKRSELDDFLGERCTVESARALQATALPAKTAVLHPVILPGRLELLVETAQGLHRHSQVLEDGQLQRLALDLAGRLRNRLSYTVAARALFDVLLRPLEALLAAQKIDTLVVVPDGVLRLIPFGALLDGEQFAIEKYAIVTAPALSLTSVAPERGGTSKALVAGLSEVGPVIDKLPVWLLKELDGEPAALQSAAAGTTAPSRERIRQALALPGVKREIATLSDSVRSEVLLDQDFTVERFEALFVTGEFRIVHIASHGVFSSSAATSWVMAYDGLLTLDRLQRLLLSDKLRERPIELLTLSACQTAEGDDRAPLGLSGAALKARARTALGTLWPVSDDATTVLMSRFYARLDGRQTTKAKALQEVQRSLIKQREFRHPFHWAAFILVGGWL